MEKRKRFFENEFLIIFAIGLYLSVFISFFTSKIDLGNYSLFLSYAIVQIVYISTIFFFSKLRKISVLQSIPTKPKTSIKKYILTFTCAIGLFFFALLPNISLTLLFSKLGLNPTVEVPPMKGFGNIALGFVIICMMPAIGEELLFRGVLASSFRNYGGVAVILLSGIIFSLSHLNIAQTVYQFFIGMVLCYIFLKTGNIIFPILFHCINNMLALFLPAGIPFFASIGLDGNSLLFLIPSFFVGLFVFVFSLRKLSDSNKEKPALALKKTFLAIASAFSPKIVKNNLKNFNKEFSKTKKIHIYTKITIIVLIILLGLTILV